jgi:16S rRNA processing protein RimM
MRIDSQFSDERVAIGKILRPKGLRGEVKVLPLSDIADRFESVSQVFIALPDGEELHEEVIGSKAYNGFEYVRFANRESRESVEMLTGGMIQVLRSAVPELPGGVYYRFEILDTEVFTDDGRLLGTVVDILETGAHDVYVVQDGEREYMIPAHQEVVQTIDREQNKIVVHPLEGLLDL